MLAGPITSFVRSSQQYLAQKDYTINPVLSQKLDLIRGLAAFMVVSWHATFFLFAEKTSDPATQVFMAATHMGGHGVVVFFVLSGFLIGKAAIAAFALHQRSGLDYAIDRITRIYVVLIPALCLGFLLDYLLTNVLALGQFTEIEQRISFPIFVANLLALQTVVAPMFGSNDPLWSLAGELWYYLMLPLGLVAIFGRKQHVRVVAAVLFIVAVAFCTRHLASTRTPHLLKYSLYWLVGVAVWIPERRLAKPWVGWLLLCVFLATAGGSFLKISGVGFLHLLGTALSVALILNSYRQSPALPSAQSTSAAAFFSGFSYSVYLYHYPFAALVAFLLSRQGLTGFDQVGFLPILVWVIFVIALYLYSYLNYLWTERHYHTIRAMVRNRLGLRGTRPLPSSAEMETAS